MDLNLYSHKSRGLKHVKNKRKFKPEIQQRNESSIKEINEERRSLQNNWSRYEECKDDNNTDLSSTNFAILAETPISKGGHFQFKSDRIADTEIDEDQLFKLDLNLIAKSISTIPLTKRCDIPEEYFTSEELQAIKSNAAVKKDEYFEYLSKTKKLVKEENEANDEVNETAINKIKDMDINSVCKDEKDINNEEKQNLEEWLDDFLDS